MDKADYRKVAQHTLWIPSRRSVLPRGHRVGLILTLRPANRQQKCGRTGKTMRTAEAPRIRVQRTLNKEGSGDSLFFFKFLSAEPKSAGPPQTHTT